MCGLGKRERAAGTAGLGSVRDARREMEMYLCEQRAKERGGGGV